MACAGNELKDCHEIALNNTKHCGSCSLVSVLDGCTSFCKRKKVSLMYFQSNSVEHISQN